MSLDIVGAASIFTLRLRANSIESSSSLSAALRVVLRCPQEFASRITEALSRVTPTEADFAYWQPLVDLVTAARCLMDLIKA